MAKQTPKSNQTLEGYLLYSSQGDDNATFSRSRPLWALTMALLTIGGCNPPMSRSGLHRAARERRTSDVVQLLADGADPNATDLHDASAGREMTTTCSHHPKRTPHGKDACRARSRPTTDPSATNGR